MSGWARTVRLGGGDGGVMGPIYPRTLSELDGNGATDHLVHAAYAGAERPMNRSGVVPEIGRRRFGEIGRVAGQVGRVEPEKGAVAQLERWLETGIQLEVGCWNEGHP